MTDADKTGIDTTTASIARSYDAMLGGNDNYAIDREVRDQLLAVAPELRMLAWDNRGFLIRATRFLAGAAGVDQFLDCGSGLPTVENTHEAAGRVNPDARVVYVDHDPLVAAHGRALLDGDESARFVAADLTDPAGLLAHPTVNETLELDRPLALYQLSTFHHLEDDADPVALMRAYVDALPSGSYVVLSHFHNPGDDPELADLAARLEATFLHSPMGTGRFRTRDEIAAYFPGLEFVEPGLVSLTDWRPDGPPPQEVEPARRLMLGGVARKP
ncbi:S-adenosyl methyltransferase [Haloactinopolyspora alba]|uniref:S-adenosyl methyltransferase n=1 Tax=Haloactinopolyspora alba TaxID=648780 RepID=A0A2P8DZ12_9ACTN|nr:SAM-dependent methyltransferase [Haloactinopolyspora alba]PSL02463.1 S-adenosyl methyltransferase [Haloactinopolyspora alba]